MYKIIIWNNHNIPTEQSIVNRTDVLVIGSTDRYLKLAELTISSDLIQQLDQNIELIFYSHGSGDNDSCTYEIEDADGQLNDYNSEDIIETILKSFTSSHNVNLHMVSCYAGKVRDQQVQVSQERSNNNE